MHEEIPQDVRAWRTTERAHLLEMRRTMAAGLHRQASEAIMYVMMAIVLLVRPRGLLGEEGMLT